MEYKQPADYYTFKDLGIDENKLFEKITKIKAHADFNNSHVTDLGNVEFIGAYADFSNSQVTSLGNLEFIGRDADFRNSRVTNLGNLATIGGIAYIKNSPLSVEDFKNVQIYGRLYTY